MAQQHEIVGIMIRDPRDNEMPPGAGQFIIEDPYSNEKLYIDAKQYNNIYKEYNEKQINLLRSIFQHNMSSLLELSTDEHFLNPMLQFFRRKGARWK